MDQQDPALGRLIDQVRHARNDRRALDIRGGGTKVFYGGQPTGEPLDVTGVGGVALEAETAGNVHDVKAALLCLILPRERLE